jgi:hypothetical protein
VIVHIAQPSDMLEGRHTHERVTIGFIHARQLYDIFGGAAAMVGARRLDERRASRGQISRSAGRPR